MAIPIKYKSDVASLREEMNELRRERGSNISRPLRQWREKHPNPYRGDTIYGIFSIHEKK